MRENLCSRPLNLMRRTRVSQARKPKTGCRCAIWVESCNHRTSLSSSPFAFRVEEQVMWSMWSLEKHSKYENLMSSLLFYDSWRKRRGHRHGQRVVVDHYVVVSLTLSESERSNGKERKILYPGHTSSITHKNEKTDIISTSSLASLFISPVTIIINSSSSSHHHSVISPIITSFPFLSHQESHTTQTIYPDHDAQVLKFHSVRPQTWKHKL